jgi:hypothetical protein
MKIRKNNRLQSEEDRQYATRCPLPLRSEGARGGEERHANGEFERG